MSGISEKFSEIKDSLLSLDTSDQQIFLERSIEHLPENKKVQTVSNATQNLTAEQQKTIAVDTAKNLPAEQQKEVAAALGLSNPTEKANDTIWLIVIGSFAIILVGVVGAMIYGWFVKNSVEPLFFTIFSTISAFLIGLFAKSPNT